MKREGLLVVINQSYKEGMAQEEVYEIARKSWRVSLERLSEVKYVFAISYSKIVGIFEAVKWQEIDSEKHQEYNGENIGRKYFDGKSVRPEVLNKYLKSDISFVTKGQQIPTLYLRENILRKYREWLEKIYTTRKETKLDKITVEASLYRLNKNIEDIVEENLIEDPIFFYLLNSEELGVLKKKLEERIGKLGDRVFAFNSYIAFRKYIETGESFIESLKEDIQNDDIRGKKMDYQRIVYGAPGTGKSYMLKQESSENFKKVILKKEVAADVDDENLGTSSRRYWAVGAFWGSENKLEDFVNNGYWENGWDDKFLDKVKEIKAGDYIAIKSAFVTRPNGVYTGTVRIKALGIVTEESKDGKVVKVNWKLKNLSNDYVGVSIRPTIQEVTDSYLKIFDPLVKEEGTKTAATETIEEAVNPIERVTFYDGYTYGQFVGTYKPVPSEQNEENITYKYIPGPLMTALVKAFQNPEHKFLLIIEEINRAKADRVFGNIFQLLDRDLEGKSEYPISISSELKKYLKEEFTEDEYQEYFEKGLYLPSNFYIWATMNNADQGVYPLDTAFKRRWKFEYIGLDDNADKFGNKDIEYCIGLKSKRNNGRNEHIVLESVSWNNFRNELNVFLLENGIYEDRLIAPFFIKISEFERDLNLDNIHWIDESTYLNKLMMYIFDDVLKHKKTVREKIFKDDILSFSTLIKVYKSGENIYSEEFLKRLAVKSEETGNGN